MRARLHSWWQKHSKPLIVVAITIVVGGVLALVLFGYLLRLAWTGFFNRTLWDWLQLLIVPLVLAIIALVFQRATSRTERQLAKQRYEQDQQITLDKQREDLLQAYLDRMSELLLKERLRSSKVDAEVRNVARVRTITLLFQLDARRIGYVFAFLRETGLMSTTPNDSIVSLKDGNLAIINFSHADLSKADLRNTSLRFANLVEANLVEANLVEADLRGAILTGANLNSAHLSEAILYDADLRGAILTGADLNSARLSGANLSRASLIKADLRGAILTGADLNSARLIEANLRGAILTGADLSKAIVTKEQLGQAESLEGATMPDGTKHA